MNKVQRKLTDLEEYNRIKKTIAQLQDSNKDLEIIRRRNDLDFSLLEMNFRRQQQKLVQEKRGINEEIHKNNMEAMHLINKVQELKRKYDLED